MSCNLQWKEVLSSAKTLITYFLFTSGFRDRSQYCSRAMSSISKSILNSLFILLIWVYISRESLSSWPALMLLSTAAISMSKTKSVTRMFSLRHLLWGTDNTLRHCLLQAEMTPMHCACTLNWQKAMWLLLLCHIHANKWDLSAPA